MRFRGLIGTNGTAASGRLVKEVCAVDADVRGGLCDVDGELGEPGVDRKRTLQGVGMRLG